MKAIHPPAVAGLFYPAEPSALARSVTSLLQDSLRHEVRIKHVPKAIIVPHAGYIYSGPIAARLYAQLIPARNTISRVVLLGPAHRVHLHGLALPDAERMATPLGEIAIDRTLYSLPSRFPQIQVNAVAHASEHSLEVQLPFLQSVLDRFTLLPFAVGEASADEIAQVLQALWGGVETLIVVSSDLSHYLPYRQARETDFATAQEIVALHAAIDHRQACGATPINGLLLEASRRQLQAELIDLRNSGDTAGTQDRVVGYGAFAFYETIH